MHSGDLLRAVRRARRLSQRELAAWSGVSRASIERIESGVAANPGLPVIARILETTGYRLAVVDHRGRALPIRPAAEEFLDRAGRRFPAHLPTQPVIHEGDGWWGWRRIAWWRSDPKVPEHCFFRVPPAYRLPRVTSDDWSEAT